MARAFNIVFCYHGKTHDAWVNEITKPGLLKFVVRLRENEFNIPQLIFYSHDDPDDLNCTDSGIDPTLVNTILEALKEKV